MKKVNFKNQLKRTTLIAILFLLGINVLGQSITLNSLTPNILCQGSSTLVNFRVTGNYNWKNVFNVELSNNLGSFASPTIIGFLPESNPGTFNITTDPINVLGTGYRIRVVSTKPAGIISGSRSIKIYPYPGPNPIIKIF